MLDSDDANQKLEAIKRLVSVRGRGQGVLIP